MSLGCAVCGSIRVTDTIETETGIKALCQFHYDAVADHAREEYAAIKAATRHRIRTGA